MGHARLRWMTATAVAASCLASFTAVAAPRDARQNPPPQTQPQAPPTTPPGDQPPDPNTGRTQQPPGTPGPATAGQGATGPGGTAPPLVARTFASPTGLLFTAVRPERVADFERALGYFLAALEKSTDPGVRAQAQGWRVMKASEPGPNGVVLYVFLIDPTVPGADYSLGPILAEAYPNPAELQQIWKLYTSALTTNGTSLMSLTPVKIPPPTGPLTLPVPIAPGAAPAAGAPSPPAPTPPAPAPAAPAPSTPPTGRP